MRIAVIGAGLAGLTAARGAAEAGHEVTIFDKSRGLGGRLATRRTEAGGIDHGAPWVEAVGAFAELLDQLVAKGAAARHGDAYVGTPGMSGLVRPLARDLYLTRGEAVTSLDAEAGTFEAGGARHGPFDRIVVAIPAPQAQALTAAEDLGAVVMAPAWTLVAAFEARLGLPDIVQPEAAPVEIALRNSAKPGRDGEAWVLHMRADWSRANLERSRAEMVPELSGLLDELTGEALPDPVHLAAHRWRYARTERPLGRPFLPLAGGRVLVGGDWALGPDAAHAWESGRAIAAALSD